MCTQEKQKRDAERRQKKEAEKLLIQRQEAEEAKKKEEASASQSVRHEKEEAVKKEVARRKQKEEDARQTRARDAERELHLKQLVGLETAFRTLIPELVDGQSFTTAADITAKLDTAADLRHICWPASRAPIQ